MDNDTSNGLLKNEDTTEKKLNRKAQRAKDSHTKRAAKKAGKPLDYAALGIAEEAIPLLKETVLKIASLGRRTTEQTFTLGLYLSEAAELIPAKMVGRWATGYCEITPRHMRNLIGVYKVLSPYQARCVDHAVAPASDVGFAENDRLYRYILHLGVGLAHRYAFHVDDKIADVL